VWVGVVLSGMVLSEDELSGKSPYPCMHAYICMHTNVCTFGGGGVGGGSSQWNGLFRG
jgi:hypothetical protein